MVSDNSATLLSASRLTIILLRPLSALGFMGTVNVKESAYFTDGNNKLYNTWLTPLGSLRVIVTRIESLTALPIFIHFTLSVKFLSATETIEGLIFINWSSIT